MNMKTRNNTCRFYYLKKKCLCLAVIPLPEPVGARLKVQEFLILASHIVRKLGVHKYAFMVYHWAQLTSNLVDGYQNGL
jgi:hypothetical protein